MNQSRPLFPADYAASRQSAIGLPGSGNVVRALDREIGDLLSDPFKNVGGKRVPTSGKNGEAMIPVEDYFLVGSGTFRILRDKAPPSSARGASMGGVRILPNPSKLSNFTMNSTITVQTAGMMYGPMLPEPAACLANDYTKIWVGKDGGPAGIMDVTLGNSPADFLDNMLWMYMPTRTWFNDNWTWLK